jgi:hypothetical protein
MRPLGILLVVLVASVSPVAVAQVTRPEPGCTQCVTAYGCESKRETCIAECRARLFAIDPKRSECLVGCDRKVIQCAQSADSSCRTKNACR